MSDLEKDLGLDEETTTPTAADGQRGNEQRECCEITLAKGLFPETWPQKADVKVTLVNLNADEELECLMNGRGVPQLVTIEMTKKSLASGLWGGKPINVAEGHDEILWDKLGSRVRNVLVAAFLRMSSAGGEDFEKSFKTFRRTTVRI